MDQQTFQIIGAAMEVHKELGRGFLEPVYQEALTLEFGDRRIPFLAQPELPIYYKGQKLKTHYHSVFVCYDDIIVELRALTRVGDTEAAQVLNYLEALADNAPYWSISDPGACNMNDLSGPPTRPKPARRNLRNLCNLRIYKNSRIYYTYIAD
jgi:GxxExxY protein